MNIERFPTESRLLSFNLKTLFKSKPLTLKIKHCMCCKCGTSVEINEISDLTPTVPIVVDPPTLQFSFECPYCQNIVPMTKKEIRKVIRYIKACDIADIKDVTELGIINKTFNDLGFLICKEKYDAAKISEATGFFIPNELKEYLESDELLQEVLYNGMTYEEYEYKKDCEKKEQEKSAHLELINTVTELLSKVNGDSAKLEETTSSNDTDEKDDEDAVKPTLEMFEYLVKKKHIRFLDTATIGQRYGWGKRNISQVAAIKLTGGFVIKMGVRYDGSVDWAYIEDSWHNFDSFYKNGFDV